MYKTIKRSKRMKIKKIKNKNTNRKTGRKKNTKKVMIWKGKKNEKKR